MPADGPHPKPARPTTYVWRASADQIAHAHEYQRHGSLSPRGRRTLCGLAITDIRLAWPAVAKCPECRAATGEKAVPMDL
jgi:hypothetical protein